MEPALIADEWTEHDLVKPNESHGSQDGQSGDVKTAGHVSLVLSRVLF